VLPRPLRDRDVLGQPNKEERRHRVDDREAREHRRQRPPELAGKHPVGEADIATAFVSRKIRLGNAERDDASGEILERPVPVVLGARDRDRQTGPLAGLPVEEVGVVVMAVEVTETGVDDQRVGRRNRIELHAVGQGGERGIGASGTLVDSGQQLPQPSGRRAREEGSPRRRRHGIKGRQGRRGILDRGGDLDCLPGRDHDGPPARREKRRLPNG
jgi:hypothetical protein